MSIKFAILGFLSYKPMTGYDLKRVIQDSPFMHWSGNNNQIYKTLQELLNDEYVTNEVYQQAHAPSKKVYSISEKGIEALKCWVVSKAELPEIKKAFLVQFAWADIIEENELDQMLYVYEDSIVKQIEAERKISSGDAVFLPDRTPREKRIWELIYENAVQTYDNELQWIKRVRGELKKQPEENISEEVAGIGEEVAAASLIVGEEEESGADKKKIEVIVNEEVNAELAEQELQRLLSHSIKVATAIEEQESLQMRFKEVLTGFDKGVGLKPGETI